MKKQMAELKVDPLVERKVDMKKVKLEVLKPRIADMVIQYAQIEDEILINLVIEVLEASQFPDGRLLQWNITGFLAQEAKPFMRDLWKLLLDAQDGIGTPYLTLFWALLMCAAEGIPMFMLEAKKKEIARQREEQQRLADELRAQRGREDRVSGRDGRRGGSRERRRSRSRSNDRRRSRSRSNDRRRGRDRSHERRRRSRSRSYERRRRSRSRSYERRRRSRSRSYERRRRSRSYERQVDRSRNRSPSPRRAATPPQPGAAEQRVGEKEAV